MILGVGIDIIEVHRVLEKVDKGNGFKEKIFSKSEVEFCESKANRGEHYAARFAAKEAFLKASGIGLGLGFELAEVEVVHDTNGKPMLNLIGNFQEKAVQHNWNKIHVSLSHVQNMACAVVIIEQ